MTQGEFRGRTHSGDIGQKGADPPAFYNVQCRNNCKNKAVFPPFKM